MSTFNHQRILRCVFTAFSALISTALATTPSWKDPYVGVYLGGGLGSTSVSTNVGMATNTSYFINETDINAINNAGTSIQNPGAMLAGLTAGHDWLWKQMVYGVVFDYGTFSLNSSKDVNNGTYSNDSDTYFINTSISTTWLFTLRGRVGYQTFLHWPSLLYLTGGMIMTRLTVNNNFNDTSALAGSGETSISENQIGWALGAGIELTSFHHLSVDLEYLYIHAPSVKTTDSISNTQAGFGIPQQSLTSPFSTTGKLHASLFKVGLNYRFYE